jgi:cyclic pyranopterin phosphate synthase
MRIEAVQLDSKRGGLRGDYQREREMVTPIVTGEGAVGEVSLGERCASPCVRVKFLAELRERVGESDLAIGLDKLPSRDVAGLKAALSAQDARFSVLADQRTLCAINQVMANDSARITDDDEVAFFPPVTGG